MENDLFADDSTLHTNGLSIADIEVALQNTIDVNEIWREANKMIIHPTKTKAMIIAARQKH